MKEKDKKFEFLFVDIEWNQKEGTIGIDDREIIQIAAIATNELFENLYKFSRFILLDDIQTLTDETYKIAHISKAIIMKSKPVKEVLLDFSKEFPKYKILVMWTRDNYILFKKIMKQEGIKIHRHNVVILQEVLSKICLESNKKIGFEAALIKAEIKYDQAQLHYALSDVTFMYELFKKIYNEYTMKTEEEYCVINERSKKIHSCDCTYISNGNNLPVENSKKLILKGYLCCNRCSSEAMWRRFEWENIPKRKKERKSTVGLRQLSPTEENIKRICDHFSLEYNINVEFVSIKTNFGYWRVYLQGNKVESVYHSNYRRNRNMYTDKKRTNEDFHKQNVKSNNFYDVVSYIFYHDRSVHSAWRKNTIEYMLDNMHQSM